MSLDARAQIVISAVAQQAIGEFQKTGQALGNLDKTTRTTKAGFDQAKQGWRDFSRGLAIGVGALAATAVAVKRMVDAFQDYALSVKDMAQKTGASVESMSALIQVADDARISQEQLTGAMRLALRNGFNPTITNLEKLADQYIAIQDPIARAKLLTDTFGRSGLEMGKMFEKGSAGIKASVDQAQKFGLILDKQAIAKAEAFYSAMDDLGDATFALKTRIGGALIPALTRLATGLLEWWDIARNAQIIMAELTVQTFEWAASMPFASEKIKLIAIALRENFEANKQFNDGMAETGPVLDEAASKMEKLAQRTGDTKGAFDDLSLSIEDTIQSQLDLAAFAAAGGGELVSVVNDVASAYAGGNINLGEMRSLLQNAQLEAIRLKIQAGLISFEEGQLAARQLGLDLGAPRKEAEDIRNALAAIRDKTVDVTINETRIIRTIHRAGEAPVKRQHGGPLGDVTLVGEQGAELIIGRTVIPAHLTRQMLALGVEPGRKMKGGGTYTGKGETSIQSWRPYRKEGAGTRTKGGSDYVSIMQGLGGGAGGEAAAQQAVSQEIAQQAEAQTQTILAAIVAQPQVIADVIGSEVTRQMQQSLRATDETNNLLRGVIAAVVSTGNSQRTGSAVAEALARTGSV